MSEINTWIDDTGVRCCNYTDHLSDKQQAIAEKDAEIERLREALQEAIGWNMELARWRCSNRHSPTDNGILPDDEALTSKGGSDECRK